MFAVRRTLAALAVAALAIALPAAGRAAPAGTSPADSAAVAQQFSVRLERTIVCPQDTLTLVLDNACSNCVAVRSIYVPATNDVRILLWPALGVACTAGTPCVASQQRLKIGMPTPTGDVRVLFYMQAQPESVLAGLHYQFEKHLTYTVRDSCFPYPLGLPYVQQVLIANGSSCDTCPPEVCDQETFNVHVTGYTPDGCHLFEGVRPGILTDANGNPTVVLDFRNTCANLCTFDTPPFTADFTLPSGLAGPHGFNLQVAINSCPDTTRHVFGSRFFAWVSDSCHEPPPPVGCVWPYLDAVGPSADSTRQCDLVLHAGGVGSVVLAAQSPPFPLAGLQGRVLPSPNLRLVRLEPAGAATGMHLVTRALPEGAIGYALYADAGAPIAANAVVPVLRAWVRADSGSAFAPGDGYLFAEVTVGSDSLGHSIPACPIMNLRFGPSAHVCLVKEASCDANGDGATDVADLVRLARCWLNPATCPDSLPVRPDCNGDGAFGVSDILCCARTILGGGPHDTTRTAAGFAMAFGTPTLVDGVVSVGLEIRGAAAMNGALLRVRFPADRYAFLPGATPTPAGMLAAQTNWLPLTEPGDGDVVIGVLRLDDAVADVVTVPLRFRVLDGQSGGGELTADQGQVIAPDGSSLTVDLTHMTAALPAAGAGTPTKVELACGPNPASGSTRFVVRLPKAALVDLGIYDLAGRRVETLVHGTLQAGETGFAWQPQGARAGLYFARLAVDGVVRTTRVTMQLAR